MVDRPSRTQALAAVRTILSYVGEDPDREGLAGTPARVVRAFEEDWCAGYVQDPAEVLKVFEDGGEKYTGLLFQGSIPVTTLCEHHICGVFGEAHFAYIANGRVVGLSKIWRLIDVFSKRLQVQERMSSQIVDAFMEHVECQGCGLVLRLRHLCMEGRGIRMPGIVTTTTDLRGIFLSEDAVKAEFLDLVGKERS